MQFLPGYRVKLVHGGSEYRELLLQLIAAARYEIHLQYYIFSDDEAGTLVAAALIAAVKRNVLVYLLVDGYESRTLSPSFIEMLVAGGVLFRRFEPLFRSRKFYVGRRLHQKVAVFDRCKAITGGINIADRYLGTGNQKPWYDLAVYLEGEPATALFDVCAAMWRDAGGKKYATFVHIGDSYAPAMHESQAFSVRVRRNDWVKSRSDIWKTYFEIFNHASERITIICSYFLPGRTFLKQIKKATARGVQVKVVLAGISDVLLAKNAERYLYRWMLRHGIEIYEFRGTVLHAKAAIRDGRLMTIGSYNVNNISALASIELNVDIRNKSFVTSVEEELEELMQLNCTHITHDNFTVWQSLWHQFIQWVSYQTIKVVLFLATFYFRQER